MRYYDIKITDPNTGALVKEYTSLVNGMTDPGALRVELDVFVAPEHQPVGNSFVRVWGIGIRDIGQASNLNGMAIAVRGGMQKGLPLANPAQAGLLFQGTINQAFGNWQGTSQTLDLNVIAAPPLMAAPDAQPAPLNIALNWAKGTPLSTAIQSALSVALPGRTIKMAISSNLVFTEDACGYYGTLTQFAEMVNRLSRAIIGGSYPGVQISLKGDTINVWDGTSPPPAKAIAFQDLVGQITWLGPGQLSVKCVMRGDIDCQDMVTLPPGQITTTAGALSQFAEPGSAFQGQFIVQSVHHVGNSRQPGGQSWVTIFDVFPAPAAA